jgi:hypothetical protein
MTGKAATCRPSLVREIEILSPFCEFPMLCRPENFASVVTPIPRFARPAFGDRPEWRRLAATAPNARLASAHAREPRRCAGLVAAI